MLTSFSCPACFSERIPFCNLLWNVRFFAVACWTLSHSSFSSRSTLTNLPSCTSCAFRIEELGRGLPAKFNIVVAVMSDPGTPPSLGGSLPSLDGSAPPTPDSIFSINYPNPKILVLGRHRSGKTTFLRRFRGRGASKFGITQLLNFLRFGKTGDTFIRWADIQVVDPDRGSWDSVSSQRIIDKLAWSAER